MTRHVAILGTGGTIAGLAQGCETGYASAQTGVEALLNEALGAEAGPWAAEQVAQIDSKDMEVAVWAQLALRCQALLKEDAVAGIVITHGTDTLEETAWFLASVLQADKPIVLTCAMRPWDDPLPDGPANLRDAVALAQVSGAHGVMVCVQRTAFSACQVIKAYARRDTAFACDVGEPVALKTEPGGWQCSAGWPPAHGTHTDAVQEGRLNLSALTERWPWIELVISRAEVHPDLPRRLHAAGAQGLVIAATGMGTVHARWQEPLADLRAKGWPVVVAGRCPFEPLDAWAAQDLPLSDVRSPYKAAITLALDVLMSETSAP